MNKEYLSPTEAAKILGISRQAVVERIKRGIIPAERAGRQTCSCLGIRVSQVAVCCLLQIALGRRVGMIRLASL